MINLVRFLSGTAVTACIAAGIALPASSAPVILSVQGASEASPDRSRLDALTWRGASSADTQQAYRAYLAEFPDGLFADLAKSKLDNSQSVPLAETSTLADGPASEPVLQPAAIEQTDSDRAPVPDADRAYRPPVRPQTPLPTLPLTPQLAKDGYPDCRELYQQRVSPFDKIDSINRCTIMIDIYYEETLNAYRQRMIDHQNEISDIYTNKVSGKVEYAGKRHDAFYDAMMKEHAASNPDGDHLEYYRELEAKYQTDRAYLEDRYCFYAGCNGYKAPDFDYAMNSKEDAGNDKKQKKSRKKSGRKKCKTARAGGGLLGGLLGGLGGKALGLGKAGTLIAGGAAAALGSELACQLSKKEQEAAAEATVEIIEKEEVGATAEWISPERKGVSGSSTVTALNTEPNGATCLDITDVAIIDGEETSISKRMCRLAGQSRYTVMA